MANYRDVSGLHPRYQLDRAFYDKVRAGKPQYKLVNKFVIPPFNGRGFKVKRGQIFRIIQEEGPQVGNLCFWNAHNPKEYFVGMRTWMLEGWFVRVYSRLWSEAPYLHPMATCIEDTVVTQPPDSEYHHHQVAGHCSPELYELKSGRTGLNGCFVNLLQGVEPFGLTEHDIHDNIDVFSKMRIGPEDGKKYVARNDSKKGDYIDFYAEMDLLVCFSVCPAGDNTASFSEPGEHTILPLGVEVHETGIRPKDALQWTDWRPIWKGKWAQPQSCLSSTASACPPARPKQVTSSYTSTLVCLSGLPRASPPVFVLRPSFVISCGRSSLTVELTRPSRT